MASTNSASVSNWPAVAELVGEYAPDAPVVCGVDVGHTYPSAPLPVGEVGRLPRVARRQHPADHVGVGVAELIRLSSSLRLTCGPISAPSSPAPIVIDSAASTTPATNSS